MTWLRNALDGVLLLGAGPEFAFGVLIVAAVIVVVLLRGLHFSRTGWMFVLGVPTAFAVAAWFVFDVLWLPFVDPFGWIIWALLWVGVFLPLLALWPRQPVLVGLDATALSRLLRLQPLWKLGRAATAAVIAVAVLLSTAGMLGAMNARFGAYRTLAGAVGVGADYRSLGDVPQGPVDGQVPGRGTLVEAQLPGARSGWNPRPAVIYLPPVYQHAGGRDLPVLVLMAGQPGAPRTWVDAGEMQMSLDAYAAAHDGAAPVVVVVDQLGGSLTSPLCSDSEAGNVAEYLQRDVPDWIEKNLQVTHDRDRWGIGGLSNGGTCALQVVTRAPDAYSLVLNFSGEAAPEVSGSASAVDVIFHGDERAYSQNNPADLMKQRRYPLVRGVFSVGAEDDRYRHELRKLCDEGRAAGMQLEWREYPGGHSWQVWRPAFADQLTWFGQQTGL